MELLRSGIEDLFQILNTTKETITSTGGGHCQQWYVVLLKTYFGMCLLGTIGTIVLTYMSNTSVEKVVLKYAERPRVDIGGNIGLTVLYLLD